MLGKHSHGTDGTIVPDFNEGEIMAGLKNHPGLWLRDDAAAAFDAYEAAHGRRTVNSAGRTVAEQQEAINRWDKGGVYNRPPYLYPPARPAGASNHVAGGGVAVDIGDYNTFKQHSDAFGFKWFGQSDPVHFDFVGGGGGGATPFSQATLDRQRWLNTSRAARLAEDGLQGSATTAAFKNYQQFLSQSWGYTGSIDGIWGTGTQQAHQRYWNAWNAPKPGVPAASGAPTRFAWKGIQQMLKALYGYTGAIDGIPGVGTVSALQRFLNASGFNAGGVDGIWGPNTSKAVQRWLKSRWGYIGAIDGILGTGSEGAWLRADIANDRAF